MGKMQEGEVRRTINGNETTPFPRVDISTRRKASNSVKRVDKWLIENAIMEAEKQNDSFNAMMFKGNKDNISQADKDSAELYLFGTLHDE